MTSPLQKDLLDFANSIMGEIDGEKVTTFQALMRTMRSLVRDKPEYGKLLLQLFLQASIEDDNRRTVLLSEALAHKEKWGAEFDRARKFGRPEPRISPHPDDIEICADGTVKFHGPVTEDDARRVDKLIELRDVAFSTVREINDRIDIPVEERREMWTMIRRQYYRYSPRIPKRLKQPFPAFEPREAQSP